MCKLDPIPRAILAAICDGPAAWRSPREVAGTLGWDVERTCDELASLDTQGLVDVWELEDGLVVTLSALGAECLWVRLDEFGRDGIPRWVGRDEPEPSPPRARNVLRADDGHRLDDLIDPNPPPDVAAAQTEAHRSHRPGRPPRPSRLLGLGLTPWPGPPRGRETTCPVCRSRPLRSDEYCLRCDRWGRDASPSASGAPAIPTRDRRSSSRSHETPSQQTAQARIERERRKQRRRAKLAAREPSRRGSSARTRPPSPSSGSA